MTSTTYEHEYYKYAWYESGAFRRRTKIIYGFVIIGFALIFNYKVFQVFSRIPVKPAFTVPLVTAVVSYFLIVRPVITYTPSIRLTIKNGYVLIRAPGANTVGSFYYDIKIPVHEITDVSVKKPADLRGTVINDKNGEFRFPTNKKLSFSPYRYVFTLRDSLPQEREFVYIKSRHQARILIEFDDAENFVALLQQQTAQQLPLPSLCTDIFTDQ